MRRAWFLVLMAASAALPAQAMAQEENDGVRTRPTRAERTERREQRQEQRVERREQRQEARQDRPVQAPQAERREQRQEFRQERSAQAPQAERRQAPAQVAPTTSQSGPWVGNPNDPSRQRYERLERQNALRYGSRDQYRGVTEQQRAQAQVEGRNWTGDSRREQRDWNQDRREIRRDRDGNRNWSGDRRGDRRNWNRSWRNDKRYDWQRYRNSNRFIFRVQPYYSPYGGYGYSRFSIGQFLDQLFWGRNYWISDPWTYRLPAAPYGFQWVRYYNDVVLVDTYTGEIVDVIYDFFW